MRLTIFTSTGYGSGIAHHLASEGHAVSVVTGVQVGSASVDTLSSTDIAFFDSNTFYPLAEMAREHGARVIGPTSWSNLLSIDSNYRTNLIKAIGYSECPVGEKGIEAHVALLFNGNRFIARTLNFNYTKMMAGDVGCDLESTGYITLFKIENSKLVNDISAPLERFLRKANHRGFFLIHTLSNQKGVFVKDISSNFCAPFTQAIYENTRRMRADVVLDVFNESSQPLSFVDPLVIGAMISVYPYPAQAPSLRTPVVGLNPYNMKHMWLVDATGSGNNWSCGQLSGCLGYVIARGISMEEVRRRLYRTISNLSISNIQYRNDLGKDINEKLYQLKELKLI